MLGLFSYNGDNLHYTIYNEHTLDIDRSFDLGEAEIPISAKVAFSLQAAVGKNVNALVSSSLSENSSLDRRNVKFVNCQVWKRGETASEQSARLLMGRNKASELC